MVVEDDPDDLYLLLRTLERLRPGLGIISALNGSEGLDYLQHCEAERRPGLLILDLNMPCMDGRELLARLALDPALRTIPAIVLTTSDQPQDRARVEAGGAVFLSKPDSLSAMVRLMDPLLQRLMPGQPAAALP
ncbi:MAG TPA: response regulator [Nevskiaceae bacterium]|nr:response regulator [Nevskiaceae bacterium]